MERAAVQKMCENSLIDNLGIEFLDTESSDTLRVRMPVDHRTRQPWGFLHGGATISLAETTGSFASYLELGEGHGCFGYHLDVNLVKAVRDGYVYATPKIVHRGRSSHIWDIRISDEADDTVALVRITVKLVTNLK